MPWRKTKEPYFIWLSEIILQQTQVSQGLPYYEAFVSNYPTVYHLANATEEEVLKLWQGLGYYSRARNLHYTAKYIVEEFKGVFPNSYKELTKLKGVGDYTASAIASICYDESCAVVDGNVYRALSRIYGIEQPINSALGIKQFKELAQSLLPRNEIGEHNQAVMEFGSIQCKPSNPKCDDCPFSKTCVAFNTNRINVLPVKIGKLKVKKRYLNYLVFQSLDNKTILNKRTEKGIWRNLYEFPVVETDKSVSKKVLADHKDFLSIIRDEYQLSLYNEKQLIHRLSHQHLYTKFWLVEVEELPKEGIPISNIESYPVPILIANFMESFGFLKAKNI